MEKNQIYSQWFKKIKNYSATLYDVAQSAIGQDDTIEKVVIVKRLPRFDDTSKEIRKSDLIYQNMEILFMIKYG